MTLASLAHCSTRRLCNIVNPSTLLILEFLQSCCKACGVVDWTPFVFSMEPSQSRTACSRALVDLSRMFFLFHFGIRWMSRHASRSVIAPKKTNDVCEHVRVLSSQAESGPWLSIRRSLAWTSRMSAPDLAPTSNKRIVWRGRLSTIAVHFPILLLLTPPAEVTAMNRLYHDVRVVESCQVCSQSVLQSSERAHMRGVVLFPFCAFTYRRNRCPPWPRFGCRACARGAVPDARCSICLRSLPNFAAADATS